MERKTLTVLELKQRIILKFKTFWFTILLVKGFCNLSMKCSFLQNTKIVILLALDDIGPLTPLLFSSDVFDWYE